MYFFKSILIILQILLLFVGVYCIAEIGFISVTIFNIIGGLLFGIINAIVLIKKLLDL